MAKPKEKKMPSWKDITATFAADSTIHGVNKMGARNLYPGRRLLWLLLVLAAVSTLSVLLYLDLIHYYDRPTLIKEVFRSANEGDFPAVTICPLKAFQGRIEDLEVLPYAQDILHEIMHVDSYLAASALTHVHLKSQEPPPTNISSWYSDPISGQAMVNWTMSSKVLTPIACPRFKGMHVMALPCCGDILEKVLTEIGSCYTMNMTKVAKHRYHSAKNRRLVIVFSLKLEDDLKIFSANGIQVIIHDQREPPLPTMRGDFVALNTVTTFRVEKTQDSHSPARYTLPTSSVGLPFPSTIHPPYFVCRTAIPQHDTPSLLHLQDCHSAGLPFPSTIHPPYFVCRTAIPQHDTPSLLRL
ncbi:acid-sensing ion channel 1-like [Gigantopelta aegis]|uniref:acid-sensing ion channel 1-like n=1 Tax=Gigantopelta aegis TaxID=1735272 RepID=UPI001B88C68D|nr:acid-sensing ion channel 1-like [Gigantopelta aegis]